MSRGLRLLGAAALACASIPMAGVTAAHADTTSLTPSNSAYFFSKGIDKPDASPAAPPNLTAEFADGVSPGHLAVAASGGQEDKVSFLYFDLFGLPEGVTLEKAVLSMKLVPTAPPDDLSYQAVADSVVACKAGDSGFSGDDGTGLDKNAPARLCDAFSAKGKAKDATTWQWDVTGLASTWLTGANDGVALTRAEGVASSFQVVFDAAPTASLALTYSAPVVVPPITPTVPLDPGAGVVAPPIGVAPPPVDGGFVAPPAVDAPAVPQPAINPPPAPAAVAAPVATPVALSTSMTPTTGFWVAGLALAAILALVSLVLGDPRVPAAATSRSRLSQALAARERLAGSPLRSRPV